MKEENKTSSEENKRYSQLSNTIHDIGISVKVGSYSDGIEVSPNARWLYLSGMLGMTTNGEIPENITQQSVLAWQNIIKLLESAKMDIRNIVKITQYITIPENIPAYSKIRSGFLGDLKPASTLLLTPQLALAEMLVEVEIIAASLAG